MPVIYRTYPDRFEKRLFVHICKENFDPADRLDYNSKTNEEQLQLFSLSRLSTAFSRHIVIFKAVAFLVLFFLELKSVLKKLVQVERERERAKLA